MTRLLPSLAALATAILACAAPTDTATPETAATTSGVSQDPACEAYLECLAAVDPETMASVQPTYGSSGTCWVDASSADLCASACTSGLADLHDANPGVPECDDGSATTAANLDGTWSFTSGDQKECEGSSIDLEQFDLTLEATSTTRLDGSAQTTFGLDSQHYTSDVDFECTFEGDALDCPQSEVDATRTWAVKGRYDATIDGTVTLRLGDGNGNFPCTLRFDAVGERQ